MASNVSEYDFIGEPCDKLKCLICLDVAEEPKQHDKCGKIFCSQCIERIKDQPCPVCKTKKPNYFTDTRASQEIRDLPVKCTNSRKGCLWKGTVATLPDHVTSCECEVVSCKYNYVGCDVKKMKKDMKRHEEEDDKHHLHLALQSVAIPTLSHGERIVFKITNYSVKKRNNEVFTSDPFYTHTNGYKMCVKVYLNGTESGANTHVSVASCLLSGPHDSNLTWPFTGTILVELLNQKENGKELYALFLHENSDNVQPGNSNLVPQYIGHSDLNREYLERDTLYFRISTVIDNTVGWLKCGKQSYPMICANKEPVVFKINDYNSLLTQQSCYESDHFYSHPNGYNINVVIWPNGISTGQGTHMSLCINILAGFCDKSLPWPFIATVKVELLNQSANENHYECSVKVDKENNLLVDDYLEVPKVIRHTELRPNKFLLNDTLYFRVSVSVGNSQPWLVCTHSKYS